MEVTPFTPSFFRRLQQLKIHTRRAFLGTRQGGHKSLRKGHGLEFYDYRPYSIGDDFRYIDWGVYGRTDRVYVRQFREEQDLNVAVLVDSSESMGYPENSDKFELAKNIALALGYVALTDGDTVTFSLLGQKNTPRYVGARSIVRASKSLHEIKPSGSFDLLTEVRAAIALQKIPGRCFLISDFLFDASSTIATLNFLRARNFETSVFQVLAPSELSLEIKGAQRVVDSESGKALNLALDSSSTKEYALKLAEHVGALETFCHSSGIHHLLISSDEDVAEVILTKLPEIGILK